MAHKSRIKEQQQKRFSAGKPMLIGAVIGFIVISLFIFDVHVPKAEWGKFWKVWPLIVEPVAGALGGLFFYFMNYMGSRGAINKTMAFVLSLFVFILLLWLGIVLALDGRMWD